MSSATNYFKNYRPGPNRGKHFVRDRPAAPLRCYCNEQQGCKSAKTTRSAVLRIYHHGGNIALPCSIVSISSSQTRNKKVTRQIKNTFATVNLMAFILKQPFYSTLRVRSFALPHRLLTCLNELVTWQRSQVRPSSPRCTSCCWWQA